MVDTARVLRTAMKKKKITNLELSDKTGYHDNTIQKWSHGDNIPKVDAFEDVLGVLGLELKVVWRKTGKEFDYE